MVGRLNGHLVAILNDRRGISAMEYAILAAAIIGVVGTAMATISSDLNTLLQNVIGQLVNAGG